MAILENYVKSLKISHPQKFCASNVSQYTVYIAQGEN